MNSAPHNISPLAKSDMHHLQNLLRGARSAIFYTLLALLSTACNSCEDPPSFSKRTLAPLLWKSPQSRSYGTPKQDFSVSWRKGVKALQSPLAIPDALETHLRAGEREKWSRALEAMARYQKSADKVLLPATRLWPILEECDNFKIEAQHLPQGWREGTQRLIQHHRNIFWRLGRLEMGAQNIQSRLGRVRDGFIRNRGEGSEEALVEPLSRIQHDLARFDTPTTRPDGEWLTGGFWPRFARHRPLVFFLDHLEFSLLEWQSRISHDARWNHLAPFVEPALIAISSWNKDFLDLLQATSNASKEFRRSELLMKGTLNEESLPQRCLLLQVSKGARSVLILERILWMQHELRTARKEIWSLKVALRRDRNGERKTWISTSINALQELERSISQHMNIFLHFEAALIQRWDKANHKLWLQLPDISNALEHRPPTLIKDLSSWRQAFFTLRNGLPNLSRPRPEPVQPIWKRRPREAYISKTLDFARSPASVAQVEQGLLGISELNAHIHRMHHQISEVCPPNHCPSLPSADIPFSPRGGAITQLWSEAPINSRTLGHNLLLLELTRLHLSRQTQRLAEMHAWLSEVSNTQSAWEPISSWDGTWDLYTDSDGSYLKFLNKKIVHFQHITDAPTLNKQRALSPTLEKLLIDQRSLSTLTIDYARFIDQERKPPIPLETLIRAWSQLHDGLQSIEKSTLERDAKLEEASKKKKQKKKKTSPPKKENAPKPH